MSGMRRVGAISIVAVVVVLGTAGCSGDKNAAVTTTRQSLVFKAGLSKSNELGVCSSYQVPQMKALLGGSSTFRILPPEPIGKKGDIVVGERCAWQRSGGGSAQLELTVEARRWQDAGGLQSQYTALRNTTIGTTDVPGIGDATFSSKSPKTSLLQVRAGNYQLTYSSVSVGSLKPVPLQSLEDLARSVIPKLS